MVLRLFPRAALGALVLLISACGVSDPRGKAAGDIGRFLDAVAADDQAAFERLVDRPSVRADLKRQAAEVARAEALEVDGGASDFAMDRMISPATLRLIASADGLAATPDAATLKAGLKRLDDHSVCLPVSVEPETCLLTFRRQGDGPFRLSGMQASALGQTLIPTL